MRASTPLAFLLAVTGALPAILDAQCPDGTPPPCGARPIGARGAAPASNSVAVLVFSNLTHDSSAAYLSDGLASEISTSLARVPRLEVRSPGAVRAAQRSGAADPQAVGRRLNVRYVVEGDFQRGGDRIRVSVRLVTVQNGTQRWTDAYTRPMTDLLAVQEEIAGAVATAIAGELLPQERTAIAAHPTRNPEAYDHLLRGNFYLAQRTPVGVRRAMDEYSVAARLDSSLSQAWARLALGYQLYIDWGWEDVLSPESLLARGFRAADRALALDSTSADGWMARGMLLMYRNPRTFEGVRQSLERAVALEPRDAEAWHQYGSVLCTMGQVADAIAPELRSIELEPGRAISYTWLGLDNEILRRDDEATRWYDSALAADRDFYPSYNARTWLRLRHGDMAGARADAEAAMRTAPTTDLYWGLAPLAAVEARAGDSATARSLAERAATPYEGAARLNPTPAAYVATALMAAGETSRALDFLERADPRGLPLRVYLVQPFFDPLRTEPRFQRLMAEIQLPGSR